MKNRKNELVLSAIGLVKAGEALEDAKAKLRRLVDQGASYESEEMKIALEEYLQLQQALPQENEENRFRLDLQHLQHLRQGGLPIQSDSRIGSD